VEATTYVDTLGGFWVTPLAFLRGHFAVGLAIPLMWNTVTADVTLPSGATLQGTESANAVGDLQLYPICMSWGGLGGDLHVSFFGYDFNTNNGTTDYHSGQVFHIDVTAAWHFLPVGKGAFGASANGFYLQQTTGDTGSGARLGSFKIMTAGIGPVISYAAKVGGTSVAVSVKWLPQIGADNTLKGNYIWAKLGVSF
jgi:hypothetical protein